MPTWVSGDLQSRLALCTMPRAELDAIFDSADISRALQQLRIDLDAFEPCGPLYAIRRMLWRLLVGTQPAPPPPRKPRLPVPQATAACLIRSPSPALHIDGLSFHPEATDRNQCGISPVGPPGPIGFADGALMDVTRLQGFLRAKLGDTTFLETYTISGMVLGRALKRCARLTCFLTPPH